MAQMVGSKILKTWFIINSYHDLVETQTTYLLMQAAKSKDYYVRFSDLTDALSYRSKPYSSDFKTANEPTSAHKISDFDIIFIRTNPGRDEKRIDAHRELLGIFNGPEAEGCRTINSHQALVNFFDKSYLLELPEVIPWSQIIYNQEELNTCFEKLDKPFLIKPLIGSRGNDIYKVEDELPKGLNFEIPWIVQEFLHNAIMGDSRIFLVHGRRFTYKGHLVGVCRVPKPGSFLGNIHKGATPQLIKLTDEIDATLSRIEDWLKTKDIAFTGVDICADRLMELNVYSPGGLHWFQKLIDDDRVANELIEALVNKP